MVRLANAVLPLLTVSVTGRLFFISLVIINGILIGIQAAPSLRVSPF